MATERQRVAKGLLRQWSEAKRTRVSRHLGEKWEDVWGPGPHQIELRSKPDCTSLSIAACLCVAPVGLPVRGEFRLSDSIWFRVRVLELAHLRTSSRIDEQRQTTHGVLHLWAVS
jgi:hypothetical protein